MCQGNDNYVYSQPITVGGPSGNYDVRSPAPNGMNSEWAVYGVVNGTGGAATAFVSADLADGATPTLQMDGSVTYSGSQTIPAVAFQLLKDSSIYPPLAFFPMKTPNVQVVTSVAASDSCYVTLIFRWKLVPIDRLNAISHEPEVDDYQEMRVNMRRQQQMELRLAEQMTKVRGR